VLQPQSNAAGVSVSATHSSGENNQEWIMVGTDDLELSPMATQQEVAAFEDIVDNQSGVAVLNGDTTKPIYFHHNKPNEQIYRYDKRVRIPKTGLEKSIDAWFPVEANRRTFCGSVKGYSQVGQDFSHDGTFNLDIDANLHIIPNRKFSFMLKNPRMESYANGRFFRERVAGYCITHFSRWLTASLRKI
jgi:hypothetical protein